MIQYANTNSDAQAFFEEETKKFYAAHPEIVEQLKVAQRVYGTFEEYLRLTQTRVILREGAGSNSEVDLSAAVSSATC